MLVCLHSLFLSNSMLYCFFPLLSLQFPGAISNPTQILVANAAEGREVPAPLAFEILKTSDKLHVKQRDKPVAKLAKKPKQDPAWTCGKETYSFVRVSEVPSTKHAKVIHRLNSEMGKGKGISWDIKWNVKNLLVVCKTCGSGARQDGGGGVAAAGAASDGAAAAASAAAAAAASAANAATSAATAALIKKVDEHDTLTGFVRDCQEKARVSLYDC